MATEEKSQPASVPVDKSDWTIDELYRKAWQIVKNNKLLWVFAAAAGAGGLSFNNGFNFGSKDFTDLQKLFNTPPPPSSNEISRVLGTASNAAVASTSTASELFSTIFSAIPVWYYVVLITELLFLILAGIIISLIYQNWATGALLENVQNCINGGKANIREASEKAFAYIKPLLLLSLVPGFLLSIGAGLVLILLIIGIAVAGTTLKIIFGILLFIAIITSALAFLMLSMSMIWAQRQIVLEKMNWRTALSSGFYISKKKFWATALLGLVNFVLSGIVTIIPIIAAGLIAFIGSLIVFFIMKALLPLWLFIGAILVITLIIGLTVLTAIITAFKATVWSLAYTNIKGKYENRSTTSSTSTTGTTSK